MPVANLRSVWNGGNLDIVDAAGAVIFTIDGSNRKVNFPTGSALEIDGTSYIVTEPAGGGGFLFQQRLRVTAAQVNAGFDLVSAVAGHTLRLVDITLIAIGGNAAAATAVLVQGVQATATVSLLSVAVAALTRSAAVKPNSANVTLLADGASFADNDAASALTIIKSGSDLTTATAIDAILTYAVTPV